MEKIERIIKENRTTVSVGVLLFMVAFFLRAWRLSSAPDIYGDAVLYTDIAINLLVYGKLIAFGKPWFVHPPLFYLVQSAFFKLVGIREVTLTNVHNSGLLTCLFSSLTIVVVFIWITSVSNYMIGTATSLVLMLEQYSFKYNRIGILESMVILFIVTSLYLFGKENDNGSFKRYVLSGVFFGLALLTKELAFYLFVTIIIWLLLTRYVSKVKVRIRRLSAFIRIAILMYLGYVIWGLSIDASAFLNTKYRLIQRAFWIIRDTGYTHPRHIPFMTDFMEVADIYFVTYILLALSPIACIYLIFREKSRTSILLSSWFIGSVVFFGFIGIRNIQFFTYITVPAAVIVGYALSKPCFLTSSRLELDTKKMSYLTVVLLGVLILYNVGVWYSLYGVGTDDAVSQSITWIKMNIPKGTNILSSYTDSYFLEDYEIWHYTIPLDYVREREIHYFVYSLRWAYSYDPALLEMILTKGEVMAVFYGQSLRKIVIYYVPHLF